MSISIESLVSVVKEAAVYEVQEGLKDNKEALNSAVKRITEYEKNIIKVMKERLNEFEEQKDKLFAFDRIRTAIFWSGCVCNVLTFLLLIYFLFFRG